jgi:fibronectin type 3 domain-containing protein
MATDGGYKGTTTITASDNRYTDKIEITWGSVSGVERYILYRSDHPMNNGYESGEAINVSTTTSYTDTDVILNKTYYYRVQFFDGDDVSEFLSAQDSGSAGESTNEWYKVQPAITSYILD